jgi:hypothetical protein
VGEQLPLGADVERVRYAPNQRTLAVQTTEKVDIPAPFDSEQFKFAGVTGRAF